MNYFEYKVINVCDTDDGKEFEFEGDTSYDLIALLKRIKLIGWELSVDMHGKLIVKRPL